MIGVIPAAGKGTRLNQGVKALVKSNGKYLIENPLLNMNSAEIKTTYIIQHGTDIENAMGDKYKDMQLKYIHQEDQNGIAGAILLLKDLIDDDMLVIFGDTIYSESISNFVKEWNVNKSNNPEIVAMFGVQSVTDKSEISKSYGLKKTENDLLITEKPENTDDFEPLLGLGIYIITPEMFSIMSKTPINPKTNQVEFTDSLNLVPAEKIAYSNLGGYYLNINTPQELDKIK